MNSEPNTAAIYFFLDGKEYAYRNWAFIPRVGDEVMLNFKQEPSAFRVKRVVWGNEERNFYPSRGIPQRVNIEIEGPLP